MVTHNSKSDLLLGSCKGFHQSGPNCHRMYGKCNEFECAISGKSQNWTFLGTTSWDVYHYYEWKILANKKKIIYLCKFTKKPSHFMLWSSKLEEGKNVF